MGATILKAECVLACANRLGEVPIWCGERRALFWVDVRGPAIHRLEPSTGALASWPMAQLVGSIALAGGGRLLAALQRGFHLVDLDSGATTLLVDPEPDQPEHRLNDGRCDRAGRFWCGSMNDVRRDPEGILYRLDEPKGLTRHLDGIIIPNGLCWSPDNRTMYFADTRKYHILAFDFDFDDGMISRPRLLVDFGTGPNRPDGSTVDADGCVWNAEMAAGRVVRYTPRGVVDTIVELPTSQPTAVTFGGDDLRTLYITTAAQNLSAEQLAREPLSGGLFAVRAGVAGLPEPVFGGR
ncbi:SMP-30/gluconolactonase/LRE family protein [Enterovirga rhinocerotis]|uniref:Gluconolactonase n=1 Tax=Enterovirga rhinocerotis TaxID=1339210 RepID=A0A4R7C4Z1_9HYPH|nr:SMP-30/gluconolactonase/LRE family protein [Enterovirga rhinocerotis]TDR92922.1 gluconolactonase [Enterovirga rhinocerotis]